MSLASWVPGPLSSQDVLSEVIWSQLCPMAHPPTRLQRSGYRPGPARPQRPHHTDPAGVGVQAPSWACGLNSGALWLERGASSLAWEVAFPLTSALSYPLWRVRNPDSPGQDTPALGLRSSTEGLRGGPRPSLLIPRSLALSHRLYPVRSPGLATGEPPEPRSNNRTVTDQVFIGCASSNLAGRILDQPRQWKKSHWALTEADPRLPPAGHMRLCRPGQSLAAWQRLDPRACPSKARSPPAMSTWTHPSPYIPGCWLLPLPGKCLAVAMVAVATGNIGIGIVGVGASKGVGARTLREVLQEDG